MAPTGAVDRIMKRRAFSITFLRCDVTLKIERRIYCGPHHWVWLRKGRRLLQQKGMGGFGAIGNYW